jgi:hypothetical protein
MIAAESYAVPNTPSQNTTSRMQLKNGRREGERCIREEVDYSDDGGGQ